MLSRKLKEGIGIGFSDGATGSSPPLNGRLPAAESVTNNSKKPCPNMPRRGPEAGFHRIYYDFMVFGANTLFMPVSTEPEFLYNQEAFGHVTEAIVGKNEGESLYSQFFTDCYCGTRKN